MAMENMSLLCVADSSRRAEYGNLHEAMGSALDFFGMHYEVFDLARDQPSLELLRDDSAMLIAQEHLGQSLSEEDVQSIIDALGEGVGPVCLDRDIHQYKDPLKQALGLKTTDRPTHMPHLQGESSVPLHLHVFKDGLEQVEQSFKEVKPYRGKVTVNSRFRDLSYRVRELRDRS